MSEDLNTAPISPSEALEGVDTTHPATAAPEPSSQAPEAVEQVKPEAPKAPSFDPVGDRSLNAGLKLLARAGVKADSHAMQQAQEGNFGPLQAVLNHIGFEDADITLQLMEDAYNRFQASEKAERDSLDRDFEKIAGGKAELKALQAWVKEAADPEELAEFESDIKAGGRVARLAMERAKYLHMIQGMQASQEPQESESFQEAAGTPSRRLGGSASPQEQFKSPTEYANQLRSLEAAGYRDDHPMVQRVQQEWLRAIEAGKA